jgi:anaphase-promoting complex subunit 2
MTPHAWRYVAQAVPLQFLRALLAYLGDSVSYDSPSSGQKSPLASHPSSCYPGIDTPSEGLVRWQLRLEYFVYETLQDLRIAKLFEIIVDYPPGDLNLVFSLVSYYRIKRDSFCGF